MVRALYKTGMTVFAVHILALMVLFWGTNSTDIVITNASAPVIFTSSLVQGKGAGVARSAKIRSTKKRSVRAKTKIPARKKFTSMYPTSSLTMQKKTHAKKESTQVREEQPLFSPAKKIIKEEVPAQEEPVIVEEGEVAEIYDPVYSSLVQYWVLPKGLKKGLTCLVQITIHPDGTNTSVCIKTSGVLAFDTAVRAALLHARYPTTAHQYTKIVEFRS